jgi:hypothetical protein
MSTGTQQHKSKIAQIACVVAACALAPIQSALGVTAADRFRGMQNLNNDSGFMKSKWFTVAMLLVLVGSITTLVIVSLYRKLRESKKQVRPRTQDIRPKIEDIRPKIEEIGTQNSKLKTDSIEQRVLNIEKQVSAIEKRLINLEQEVSSFEVIEADSAPDKDVRGQASSPQDEPNVIQASANANEGTK